MGKVAVLRLQIELLEGLASRGRTSDQASLVALSVLDSLVGAVAVHGDGDEEPERGDDGTDRQNQNLGARQNEGVGSVVQLIDLLVNSSEGSREVGLDGLLGEDTSEESSFVERDIGCDFGASRSVGLEGEGRQNKSFQIRPLG